MSTRGAACRWYTGDEPGVPSHRQAPLLDDEVQPRALRRERGPPAMAGEHGEVGLEPGQARERIDHGLGRPTREVGPAPGTGEERVPVNSSRSSVACRQIEPSV